MKDVHGLQSIVSTHSEESDSVLFNPLFAITNAFNICTSKREFSYFCRGVGLGVLSVHHCHQEIKSEIGAWLWLKESII